MSLLYAMFELYYQSLSILRNPELPLNLLSAIVLGVKYEYF